MPWPIPSFCKCLKFQSNAEGLRRKHFHCANLMNEMEGRAMSEVVALIALLSLAIWAALLIVWWQR